ncbi:hypothetical protein BJ165DRAFT_422142 [Panaeolus papilionaceus]|nr:hypothetical protein BJ165DRAFT_422142 [Panaeolus papilionaceus]
MGKGMQYFEFQNTAVSANEILTAALEIATNLPKHFVLENMKTSLKKPPVLTPMFHLLSDRYRSVILLISNAEEDIQRPFTEEVLRAERHKLQGLRNDLGGLRSEMLEFGKGRWLVAKIDVLNLPSTLRSAVQTTVDRFTTPQPSPQIPANIPIPDHGHTKVNIPDKPPPSDIALWVPINPESLYFLDETPIDVAPVKAEDIQMDDIVIA